MAIAFVSITNTPSTDTQSSITQSVTVPSGTNRLMVVCIQESGSGTNTPASSVVFNGSESLTKVRADQYSGGPYYNTEVWYRVAPSVTTANVVATWPTNFNDRAMAYSVVLLTGVAQSSLIGGSNGATGTNQSPQCSVTTDTANSWIIDSCIGRDDAGLTMGTQTNRTQRALRTIGAAVEGVGVSTLGPKVTPGAQTMDWAENGAGGVYEWSTTAVEFRPAISDHPLTIDSGSYTSTGTDTTLRIGATAYLRYRK